MSTGPLCFPSCCRRLLHLQLGMQNRALYFYLKDRKQTMPTKLKKQTPLLPLLRNHSSSSSLPDYNYNLPGEGKTKKRKNYKINQKIIGEMLYGIHPVLLALKIKKRACHKLYIQKASERSSLHQEIISLCNERNITVMAVEKSILDQMSGSRPHQGVCMDVSSLKVEDLSLETFRQSHSMDAGPPLWLLLFRVQDPMNFGAILRSSYYLGVDRIIFSRENSAPINPVVSKSSAGALELMAMSATLTEQSLIYMLKVQRKNGWKLVGTVGRNHGQLPGSPTPTAVEKVLLADPTVLVIGNEGCGITDHLLQLCDQLVTIDSKVDSKTLNIDSLNVSVATGILLHTLKQKSGL